MFPARIAEIIKSDRETCNKLFDDTETIRSIIFLSVGSLCVRVLSINKWVHHQYNQQRTTKQQNFTKW